MKLPRSTDNLCFGAVMYVFVSSPDQGYGVYIDWMLEEVAQI